MDRFNPTNGSYVEPVIPRQVGVTVTLLLEGTVAKFARKRLCRILEMLLPKVTARVVNALKVFTTCQAQCTPSVGESNAFHHF